MGLSKRNVIAVLGIVLMLLASPLILSNDSTSGAPNSDSVLFDMGNGDTTWGDFTPNTGDTISDVIERAATASGIDYSYSSGIVTINGITQTTVGDSVGSGGTFGISGTTGSVVTSDWSTFIWDDSSGWTAIGLDSVYTSGTLAIAFYPSGITPVETPDHRSSWTMVRGDAQQNGGQEYTPDSTSDASVDWTKVRGGTSGVCASPLTVQGLVFVKYGSGKNLDPAVICYDASGNIKWTFTYPGIESYETTTPVIVGDYIYVQSGLGYIFKFKWDPITGGPGSDNSNVTTFDGKAWDQIDFISYSDSIPYNTATLTGFPYSTGPGSLVFDSGCIYLNSSNGMVYCFDTDLNLIWSSQMGGHTYYISPTISDGYVFAGALDGNLYVMDKMTGDILANTLVYNRTIEGKPYGSVSSTSVFKESNQKYTLMFTYSDGRGMNSTVGGVGIYEFNATTQILSKKSTIQDVFGLVSNYVQPVVTSDFKGVYLPGTKGIFSVSTDGTYKLLNDTIYSVKAPLTLLNGKTLLVVSYQPGKPIYEIGLDGKILSEYTPSTTVRNYAMSPAIIVDGKIFAGNDAGLVVINGTMPVYSEPVNEAAPWWHSLIWLIAAIIIIIAAIYLILRYVKGIEKPFSYIRGRMSNYVKGDDLKHNTRNKHRLLVVMLIGISLTLILFIVSLCVGTTLTLSVTDMFSSLFSAISKGGQGLTYDELMVYESRLPRALAAMAVGIGLSIAGCMYQAIIRNPLVDPYIMGVSAGAGTAAVAVIAFNFTFFGLFSPHSLYLTAFSAIIGGLVAFAATMFIAEKSGGNSLNYVLAGVVIGLAFSAIQTLMLSMAGQNVSNALNWLFGSFANITWSQVGLIVIPAIALSVVPLIWAKEFNLVLLGEDQAQQMGLNVRKFNRTMLILASVLTAICVAFVGIIGFVGLVVPHLCRMMLGGDHRLVLPASIAFGGALMLIADLAARTLYYGQELPVGAITTIIGVPVFAYLLIKRGKLYEG